jgi:hypothetical protein
MAFVVEDGTGIPAATSYGDSLEADDYFPTNATWNAASADAKEDALVQATTYIDGAYRFKGVKLTAAQGLQFPRSGAIDWSGNEIVGIPRRLKQATFEMAVRALAGRPLQPDTERGGQIKRETVGPITTEYADGAPPGNSYPAVDLLLREFLHGDSGNERMVSVADVRGDGMPARDPVFDLGMHDRPGSFQPWRR